MCDDLAVSLCFQDILINLHPLLAAPDNWCCMSIPVAKWFEHYQPTPEELDSNKHYSFEVVTLNPIMIPVLRWYFDSFPVPRHQCHYIVTDDKSIFANNCIRAQLTFQSEFLSAQVYKTSSLLPKFPRK